MPRPAPPRHGLAASLAEGTRRAVGLAAGAVTAAVELGYLAVAGLVALPVLVWKPPLTAVTRSANVGARGLAELERRRLRRWFRTETAGAGRVLAVLRYLGS